MRRIIHTARDRMARCQLRAGSCLHRVGQAVLGRVEQPGSRRPRLLILANEPGWAFDDLGQQRKKHMIGSWDVDVRYVGEEDQIDPADYDLLFDPNWGYREFDRQFHGRYVRGINSHKWQRDACPSRVLKSSLRGAVACFVPNRAQLAAIQPVFPATFLVAEGSDPEQFQWQSDRIDADLVVGWSGNPQNQMKRLNTVIRPACERAGVRLIAEPVPTRAELNRLYNSVDLVLIASEPLYEGNPLSLFEAGLCGRAVLATNVGCVPEVVEDGVNGLVVKATFDVEETIAAFVDRLEWCKRHVTEVRAMGKAHRERVLAERTPQKTCETFRQAIEWAHAHCWH